MCGILAIIISLIPSFYVEPRVLTIVIDTVLCAGVLVLLLACWPDSLRTDQFGIWRESPYPFRKTFIPWREVASVEEKQRFRSFLSGRGIDNGALVVYSSNGKKIVHGPEHSDRPRFLHELSIHGAPDQPEQDPDDERE